LCPIIGKVLEQCVHQRERWVYRSHAASGESFIEAAEDRSGVDDNVEVILAVG
jgi:hypothetical protein